MRRLLILLLLAGCGGGPDDNHGYGFAYDVQGASGLRLRFNPAEPVDQRTPVEIFENTYMEVQKCAGLTAPAPMVIVVPEGTFGYSGGHYYSDPPLVVVTALFMFKHEVIHYLLDHNTGNLDPDHLSPLFTKCS